MIEQNIVTEILNQLGYYTSGLDWGYILTFIIMAYALNKMMESKIGCKWFPWKIPTRYRVAILGFLYAILIFFVRGYELAQVELVFQSFLFAIVFHKMILEGLIKFLEKSLPQDSSGEGTGSK